MNPEFLLKVGELLLTLGPAFVKEVEALRAAGSAKPEDLTALEAQIEAMDTQRMESWASADAALTAAIQDTF